MESENSNHKDLGPDPELQEWEAYAKLSKIAKTPIFFCDKIFFILGVIPALLLAIVANEYGFLSDRPLYERNLALVIMLAFPFVVACYRMYCLKNPEHSSTTHLLGQDGMNSIILEKYIKNKKKQMKWFVDFVILILISISIHMILPFDFMLYVNLSWIIYINVLTIGLIARTMEENIETQQYNIRKTLLKDMPR